MGRIGMSMDDSFWYTSKVRYRKNDPDQKLKTKKKKKEKKMPKEVYMTTKKYCYNGSDNKCKFYRGDSFCGGCTLGFKLPKREKRTGTYYHPAFRGYYDNYSSWSEDYTYYRITRPSECKKNFVKRVREKEGL